ncbi:Glutathione S-transferase [Rhynchospora pubera]|uniref:Glutathione S-transferase n=1 Tax=Rhynchospora pubera TaxID=906938 RepID=A0AAV8F5D9_9POAL|nr:Glutathione S-transferase [Rhynchospora pubera]
MGLKVYAARISEPSRAVIIFCRANDVEFEEVVIDLSKGQHKTTEYAKINPMGQVPAITDGELNLYERYPNEPTQRAKIDVILDWHHSNLRRGALTYIFNTTLGSIVGARPNAEIAQKGKKILCSSLAKIENLWLKDGLKFLLGNSQPSIADLSLSCQVMQLQAVGEKEAERILEQHQKIRDWVENVKKATEPHFSEVHEVLEYWKNKASPKL